MDTQPGSHVPYHEIGFNPIAFNFSVAEDDAFLEPWQSCEASAGRTPGVGGGSNVEEGSFGVGALPAPGCLKIPKLMALLCPCGCMLQEMV